MYVDSKAPQKRQRTKAATAHTVRAAKDVFGLPRRRTTCPYDYEIKDGHMFIEGEDFGDVNEFFAKGKLLREFVSACHQIAYA